MDSSLSLMTLLKVLATAVASIIAIVTLAPSGGVPASSQGAQVSGAIDTTVPAVSITAPTRNQLVAERVVIKASASPALGNTVAGVRFLLDGKYFGAEDVVSPFQRGWNTASSTNGTHTVAAVVRDSSGNRATSTVVSVRVQNPAVDPVLTITSDPFIVGPLSRSSATIKWSAKNVSSCRVTGPNISANGLTGSRDTGALSANATYVLTCQSPLGVKTAQTTVLVISGSSGQFSATPSSGTAPLTTTFRVEGYFDDVSPGYYSYSVNFGDGTIANDLLPPQTFEHTYTNPGTYIPQISICTNDQFYCNSYTTTVVVTTPVADTIPPKISFATPAEGATVSATTTISVTSTDNIGVVGVTFRIDGTAVERDTTSPYRFSWDSRSVPNGSYRILAVVRDAAGNRATTTRNIVVSNTAPPPLPQWAPLYRYFNGWDHMALARPLTAEEVAGGYVREGILGYISTVPGAGLLQLNECRQAGHPYNHFTSFHENCESTTGQQHIFDEIIGYATKQPAPDLVPIYRCFRSTGIRADHFLSRSANCEGAAVANSVLQFYLPPVVPSSASCILTATPSTITRGATTTLAWTTSGATSGAINPGAIAMSSLPAGSTVVAPPTTRTYVATVKDASGKTATCSAPVTVEAAPLAFEKGDTVSPTARIAVRSTYSTTAPRLGIKDPGALGTIVDGPETAQNYTWWKVSWPPPAGSRALTLVGWSVQNYLEAAVAPPQSCTLDGVVVLHGESHRFYSVRVSTPALRCIALSQLRICTNGVLSGDSQYQYASCSVTEDTTPPTVSLLAPEDGTTVKGAVLLRAAASDDSGSVIVKFRIDGTNVDRDTEPPFRSSWDSTTLANGTYLLRAIARDAAGNRATSTTHTITVANQIVQEPSCSITATPNAITRGQSSVLEWASSNATGGVINPGAIPMPDVAAGRATTTPARTTTYTATVTNTVGSDTCTVTIGVDAPAPIFEEGDTVSPTVRVAIRATPTTSGTRLGVQGPDALGTIVGGSETANNYTWWNVDWTTGVDGWSVQNYLEATVAPPQSCTLDGVIVLHGASHTFFSSRAVLPPNSCATISQVRTCTDGVLSGDSQYQYGTCEVTTPPKFSDGDRVEATARLSVRETPGGTLLLPRQGVSARGTVLDDAPQKAKAGGIEYTWWNIDWDVLPKGWSAEDFVEKAPTPSDDTTSPTVSITAPASGTVSGEVAVSATATDTGSGVESVTFKDGLSKILADITAPSGDVFTYLWNTLLETNGPHTLFAVARDKAGNVATSSARSVTVDNGTVSTPPNIVVIMTDDQTVAEMDVMKETKRLLADRGVTFTESFTDFPLCCPSRSTFLSGQAAHNHGVRANGPQPNPENDGGYEKFKLTEGNTLPVWLQSAGYTTMSIGKYMNGYGGRGPDASLANKTHVPPGWSAWYGAPDNTAYWFWNYELNENGTLVKYGCSANDYKTDVYARKSVDFIQQQESSGKPFFMWIQPLAPHGGGVGKCAGRQASPGPQVADRHAGTLSAFPIVRPPNFNEQDTSDKPSFFASEFPKVLNDARQAEMDRRQRVARESLLAVDELVQEVVQELERTGKLDNTLIIFTSDNGFLFGEHRIETKKVHPYEESIRIPLIVRGPGVPSNATRNQLVNNTDVVATIVEAAGATAGRVLDGKSLLPLAKSASTPWRTALLFQSLIYGVQEPAEEDLADLSASVQRAAKPPIVTYKAVRTANAKYVEYSDGNRELYDLAADPYEMQSRHADPSYSALRSSLAATLDTLRACAGDGCWATDTALLPPTANPPVGVYTVPQNITLSAPGSSSIRYTTSGVNPTCTSGTLYAASITVVSTQTIKAIACYGSGASSVATFAYIIQTDSCPADTSATSAGAPITQGKAVTFEWTGTGAPSAVSDEDDESEEVGAGVGVNTAAIYHSQHMTAQTVVTPDKVAVANGPWSSTATWGGNVPTGNQSVHVPAGRTVTLDATARARTVEVNGVLRADPTKDSSLTARWVMVHGANARFQVGTADTPFLRSFVLELTGTDVTENIHGAGTKFLMAMDGGEIQMHGKPQVSWTKLATTAAVGATQITLSEAVEWNIGDAIVIASSRLDPNEAEERVIAAKSANCRTLTLNQPLQFPHVGVRQNYSGTGSNAGKTWTLDQRAEVALLTRNVKVQGDAASEAKGFGGHIMVMGSTTVPTATGKGYFSNIELTRMGQKPQKSIGFTGMGRYPIHWHLLQDSGAGQYMKSSSIYHTYNRALTIHGTNYLAIEHNVMYDHVGHGLFLEDGAEQHNKINYNLVLLTKKPRKLDALLPTDVSPDTPIDRTPASFWITNPNNEFIGNVAAGNETGTGFWFVLPQEVVGPSKELYPSLVPHQQPLGAFRGNSAHSSMIGLDVHDGLVLYGEGKNSLKRYVTWSQPAVLQNFTVYANELGVYFGNSGGFPKNYKIVLRNLVGADMNEHIGFATYGVVENSLFVADSGNGILPSDVQRAFYAVHNGAGRVSGSHVVGFDQQGTTLFLNGARPNKRANHIFTAMSFAPASPRVVFLDHAGALPDTILANGSMWNVTIRDADGSITGIPDSTIITNHPLLRTSSDTPLANSKNAWVSRHHFAATRISFVGTDGRDNPEKPEPDKPDVQYTRERGSETIVFTEVHSNVGGSRNLHTIVNEDYIYEIAPLWLHPSKEILIEHNDAQVGDTVLLRFARFGDLVGLSLAPQWAAHNSLASLKNSGANGYFIDEQKNLWLRFVHVQGDDKVTVSWTGTGTWTPPSDDTIAPTVSLTTPAIDSVASSTITIRATASDNVGVVGVQFKVDGTNVGAEATTTPYSMRWNTRTFANSPHTITAVARDAAGNATTSSPVGVTVDNIVTPPTFQSGDRVQATQGLRVRSTAGGTVFTPVQKKDARGTIENNPPQKAKVAGVEYTWYRVNWDTAPDGWSAEEFMEEASAPKPPPAVTISIVGTPEEAIIPKSEYDCPTERPGANVLDGSVHVFRDDVGKLHISATNHQNFPFIASSFAFTDIEQDCDPMILPQYKHDRMATPTPETFDQIKWLGGRWYTLDGKTVYAYIHNEFHGEDYNSLRPDPPSRPTGCVVSGTECWMASITKYISTNSGYNFNRLPTNYFLASSLYPFTPKLPSGEVSGRSGARGQSNVFKGRDGAYYMYVGRVENFGPQESGMCLMRSTDLNQWYYWDGAGFTKQFENQYTSPETAKNHVCPIVSADSIFTVVYNPDFDVFIGSIARQKKFYYATTKNLTDWSEKKELRDQVSVDGPAFIDHESTSRNFDTTGLNPYLYYGDNPTHDNQINIAEYVSRVKLAICAPSQASCAPTTDPTPPTVSITAPRGGTVKNTVPLRAQAEDNAGGSGMKNAQFQVGGNNIGAPIISTTNVYAYQWDSTATTNGSHTITAVATDNAGNTKISSPVSVTVENETIPPKFTNGDRVEATSNVQVRIPAGGPTQGRQLKTARGTVEGGPVKATRAGIEYTWWNINWDTAPDGWVAEDFMEKAVDDTTKPVVTLTAPAAGETIKNIITLRATSTDNVGVVDVAWKIGNTEIARATSTNQVFSARWDTKSVTNGTTTLRAVARDAAGNIATSSAVSVAVNNATSCAASQSAVSIQQGRAVKIQWGGTQADERAAASEDEATESAERSFPNIDTAAQYQHQHATSKAAPKATKTAAALGDLWSDPNTWGGSVPGPSDNVTIPVGKTVVIDTNARAATVTVNGTLRAGDTNASLTTRWVMVMGAGAKFQVGTAGEPFEQKFTLELIGTNTGENIHGAGTKFLMAMDGGEIQLHGKPQVSWTKLAATVEKNAKTITLADAVAWSVGDTVVIASSYAPLSVDPSRATETRTITATSADCKTLTLDKPLTYRHVGAQKSYTNGTKSWILDERAEVGLLSHNIQVQGDAASEATGFGGHIMIMNCPVDGSCTAGKGYFSNIEITRMGQKKGMGRYPIHWHLLQGEGAGQYITNSSIHHTYNRALTVHGTDRLLIERNVMYDHPGHGVFLEDGGERFNKFYYNLVLVTKRPLPQDALLPSDFALNEVQNRTPASFWITNPNNEFIGNVAGGTMGTGFWFALPYSPHGPSAGLPYFSGLVPIRQPLGAFKGNVAHSTMSGIDIHDSIESGTEAIMKNDAWNPPANVYLEDFTVYANHLGLYSGSNNIYLGYLEKIIFRNVMSADMTQAHVRFANSDTVTGSLFVADSGNGIPQPLRAVPTMYVQYDGPGRVYDSHVVGFDQVGTRFISSGGAAQKHANHLFAGFTFDPQTKPRIVYEDFSNVTDATSISANGSRWSATVKDVDGSLTGKPGYSIVTNHPIIHTKTDTPWPTGEFAYVSKHAFIALQLYFGPGVISTPPITWQREGGDEPNVSFRDASEKAVWRLIHTIANEDYVYGITMPQQGFTLRTFDANVGDYVLLRVNESGGVRAQPPFAWQAQTSVQDLKDAAADSYFIDEGGNLWLKVITNSIEDRNDVVISWDSGSLPPSGQTNTAVPIAPATPTPGSPAPAISTGDHSHTTFCTLTRNLARGASGDDVSCLQHFLQHQGLLTEADVIGTYGPRTERAVREWQCARNIVCSGTPNTTGYGAVGPRTRAALNAAMATTAPSASAAPSTDEAHAQLASTLTALEALVDGLLDIFSPDPSTQ